MFAGTLITLAACTPDGPPPVLAYRSQAPVLLPVAYFDIEDRRQPLPSANFIDERRSDELAEEVRAYLRNRFNTGGGSGSAVAVIEQASVTERLVEGRSGGLLGIVTGEPTYGLDGTLTVRIVERGPTGEEVGYGRASVARSREVRAGTTVVQRDAEARALAVELVNQLDPALVQAVRENLRASGGT